MIALLTFVLALQDADPWTIALRRRDGSEERGSIVGADAGGVRFRTGGLTFYYNWFELDVQSAAAVKAALDLDLDAVAPKIRLHLKDGRQIEAASIALTPGGVRVDGAEIPLRDLARISGLTGKRADPVDDAEVDRMIRLMIPTRSPEAWKSISQAYLKTGLLAQARAATRAAALLSDADAAGHGVWSAAAQWLNLTAKRWDRDEAIVVEGLLLADRPQAALDALRALRRDPRWGELGGNNAGVEADLETAITADLEVPYEARIRHDWTRALEAELRRLSGESMADAERAVRDSLVRTLDSRLSMRYVPRSPSDTPSATAGRLAAPEVFRYGAAAPLRDLPAGPDRDAAWDRADGETRMHYLRGLHIESFHDVAGNELRDGDRVITYR